VTAVGVAAGRGDRNQTGPPARRHKQRNWRRLGTGAIGLTGVVIGWQIASLVIADPLTLPSVPFTVDTLWHYSFHDYPAQNTTLVGHAWASSRRVLIGFVLGSALGISIGAAMSASRTIRDLVDPLIQVTRPLPPLAFIPLLVVWFGVGESSKVILIAVGTVPVLAIATLAALDQVPHTLLLASHSLGASPLHTLIHVRLRSALPGVIVGLRLAMGGAWTSIIAAEYVDLSRGIGAVIQLGSTDFRTEIIFAGIIIIAVLGLSMDAVLRLLYRLTDPSTR
jgi:ABC-type nitrate/sulfonate/bicarbonate transport system permease component